MWEVGEKKEEGKRVGSLDQETDCVTTSADSGRNWCFCPTSVVLATPPQFWIQYAMQSYHSACWRLYLNFQS